METKDRIRKFRKERCLSTTDLGRLSGISQSTISKIENGKRKIELETLSKIAKALGVSLEQLTGESASSIIEDRLPGYRSIEPDNLFEVPVLGTIRAGQPIYAQENIEGYMLVDRSIARVGPGEEVFYLRVTGDSMTPKYQPGDLVLIRRQPAVANGEVASVISDAVALGKGRIIISTPSGSSENNSIPLLFVDKSTVLQQIGLDLINWEGDKEVFLYIDKVFIETKQGGERSSGSLTLEDDFLKVGVHKVSAIQFENNNPENKVVGYHEASFEIKPKS